MQEKGVLLSPSHLDAASHDLSIHHARYQKQEKLCEAPPRVLALQPHSAVVTQGQGAQTALRQ